MVGPSVIQSIGKMPAGRERYLGVGGPLGKPGDKSPWREIGGKRLGMRQGSVGQACRSPSIATGSGNRWQERDSV